MSDAEQYYRQKLLDKVLSTNCTPSAAGELVVETELNHPILKHSESEQAAIRRAIEAAVRSLADSVGTYVEIGPGPLPAAKPQPSVAQHWDRYRHRLVSKGWSKSAIDVIDIYTGRLLARLPSDEATAQHRGLVLGYVQSGKTANMMGLIAKAAERGWNFVIILAGLTDALRRQTQGRVLDDLIDGNERYWEQLTTADSDFVDTMGTGFAPLANGHLRLAVVKKNRWVLDKLTAKLKDTAGPNLKKMKVLVIDDECDQASVNGAQKPEEISAINAAVRGLLGLLPHHAYVGYTATPFANVLIDPEIDPSNAMDLYPRDFIVSLPSPTAYFGAERLFGRGLIEADEADDAAGPNDGLDMIRSVPESEVPLLSPGRLAKRKDGKSPDLESVWSPKLTPKLLEAIAWYCLAMGVRTLRGHEAEHSSMLIHTTVRVAAHRMIAAEVANHLEALRLLLGRKDMATVNAWRELYERETQAIPPDEFGHPDTPFEDALAAAQELLQRPADQGGFEVVIENSESDARLDYSARTSDDGRPLGRRYIVVGGNVLARGLTIEGLVSSYFLRSSTQYDTLMQMGRWFGYRKGYEDLPRLWMTEGMSAAFQQLATIEAEIREDIKAYSGADGGQALSPLEFAVRIRHIPGMLVTSKAKMRAARELRISWSGRHIQTRRFKHRDRGWLSLNLEALERLLCVAGESASGNGGRCWRSVAASDIGTFLEEYTAHEHHAEFERAGLVEFVEQLKEKHGVERWNVGLVEPATGRLASPLLPASLGERLPEARMVNRARFRTIDDGAGVDIKALMSRTDVRIDIGDAAVKGKSTWVGLKTARQEALDAPTPLLLLYLIDPDSKPQRQKSKFEDLNALLPVLGIGLVFPEVEDPRGHLYYRVRLEETDPEESVELPPVSRTDGPSTP